MEKYTKRENGGNAVIRGDSIYSDCGTPEGFKGDAIDRLAAYEDTGLEPGEILHLQSGVIPAHWRDLFRAECEGRLLVLPCKVGDTVYYIDGYKSYKAKAHTFRFNGSGVRVYCERKFMGITGFEGIYGKTVFLTREEAEAALKQEVESNG